MSDLPTYFFRPEPEDTVLLNGVILPAREEAPGAFVLCSAATVREFDESDRAYLQQFARLLTWSEALEVMVDLGGGERNLLDLIESGFLIRFPARFTAAEMQDMFTSRALVSTTGSSSRGSDEGRVVEVLFGETGRVVARMSRVLFEVILRSDGTCSTAQVIEEMVGDAAFRRAGVHPSQAKIWLYEELAGILADLVNSGACGIIESYDGPTPQRASRWRRRR